MAETVKNKKIEEIELSDSDLNAELDKIAHEIKTINDVKKVENKKIS